ncbi:zf-HC2 domain-containing protein [Streptomyces neyagawaensis]|uniref:zf-HC2 domain-containing protein n=1 Tax=Streptomyces neyagawaensis TaxID=42238 RepID=UPI00197EC71A|nr:zf-HC2 domain-containing protein [Streptomyces neyagawaensis]MCL6736816.1 zf-HC2 domain-containing protein [Streptomyces neyagawaensis]MDE1684584.1 zf-HC2 domain-containing protein [Streptomyces neyagawaensis]
MPGSVQGAQGSGDNIHETVGAYALGILDDAEATQFEAHLATCEWCGQQLDELAGMEPMLAALADLPAAQGTPAIGESLAAKPSTKLSDRLVGEVVQHRAKKSRRNFFMLAAGIAAIVAGPTAVFATTGGDSGTPSAKPGVENQAQTVFTAIDDKVQRTDASTKVSATVAMKEKAWGTQAVLELKNVKGPEKCSLIAVGKNGERETVTSWSVPTWGYGIEGAKTEQARKPLYVEGGAAFTPDEIDHFEVLTFSGKKLVQVEA